MLRAFHMDRGVPAGYGEGVQGEGARRAWAYSQMGLQLAVTAGLGLGAGLWADRRWGIAPWEILGGLALGSGLGLAVFILDAMRMGREEDEEEEERKRK